MKMSELVMVAKLQPEHITEDFCTQHSISSQSADHCKQLLRQWSPRQEGQILLQINPYILNQVELCNYYFSLYYEWYFLYWQWLLIE